jgi:hypothetical protein
MNLLDAVRVQLDHVELDATLAGIQARRSALGVDHSDPAAEAFRDPERRVGLAAAGRADQPEPQFRRRLRCLLKVLCSERQHVADGPRPRIDLDDVGVGLDQQLAVVVVSNPAVVV